MHITTRITRHGGQLFALGAVAALAAGCSAGPAPGGGSASEGSQAPSGAQSDVQGAAAPAEERSADHEDPDAAQLPEDWSGTVSAQQFAPEDPSAYLAMVALHGDRAVTEMSAEEIENSEFLAGTGADCDGGAVLGGGAASCDVTTIDGSGEQRSAQVRLVETGFGHTALLFGVSATGGADLAVATGAAQGLQSIGDQELSSVTAGDLESAAASAVMRGFAHDGELPEDLSVACEVDDGGEHGVCEVAGTPDGGGDGTWLATAQRGFDGDRAAYLFTQLPQE